MGIWSLPWETEAKAKTFASKVKDGIIVHVENLPSGELGISSDGISFRFDEAALLGTDELSDLIYDKALKENKNFDATHLVVEVMKPILKEMEIQPELPKNLQAINIVRESIGLSPLNKNTPLSDSGKIAKKIITYIKDNNIAIDYYELKELRGPLQAIIKMMNRIPSDLEADIYYSLTVETTEKKEFELDFNSIPEVKGFGYDRPGLFRMCFITD